MSNNSNVISLDEASELAAVGNGHHRSQHDSDNIDLITRSLASIHNEIELGTYVDADMVHGIEIGLAHLNENN